MNDEFKELFKSIEELDWTVTNEGENQYLLSKYSPAGQDFNITVEGDNVDDFIENINQAYENFDVSEETYLWLDNTGHGKNGAPYHMRDLLEDMEACETMILDLYTSLRSLF